MTLFDARFYLFGSRLLTHLLFWAIYYISFSFIWINPEQGLFGAFFLEFVLLPARVMAVYCMIYWLMPNLLLAKRFKCFFGYYAAMMLSVGAAQVLAYYFFYQTLYLQTQGSIWDLSLFVRSIMLVNSTVIFVAAIKLLQTYLNQTSTAMDLQDKIEIRANRRTYLIEPDSILYLQGMGNYVSYYLHTGEKLVAYGSIKGALETLPTQFMRLHKSYVVNRKHIDSFSPEDVHIKGDSLPRGKDVSDLALSYRFNKVESLRKVPA